MKVIYAFPEPLPLDRARGLQAAHTAVELARLGVDLTLFHVPGEGHPLRHYGLDAPPSLRLEPLSRSLAWPLARVHSNRLFARRLLRRLEVARGDAVIFVRHVKLASLILEKRPDLRLVYEAHEVFSDTAPASQKQARSEEEARIVRGCRALVANSAATAARLAALYGDPKIQAVIPNGVERAETLPEKDWSNAGRHVIYAGSLFPWKGAADLVEAAARLPGRRIELVGGEEQRIAELRSRIAAGGAEVVLAGHLPHPDAMQRLAGACIAVLPNRDSVDSAFTSPIKLFEYMAAGCAVVATDLPAVREILGPEDAVWAKPGDPASLAAAIGALAADPARSRALGQRLREKSRGYTWRARAQKVKALLEQVAGQ